MAALTASTRNRGIPSLCHCSAAHRTSSSFCTRQSFLDNLNSRGKSPRSACSRRVSTR